MSLRYSICFRFQHQRQLAWSILITKEIVGIQLEIKDNLPASCICIFSPLSCSAPRLHFSECGNRKSPNLWTVNFEPWTVTVFVNSELGLLNREPWTLNRLTQVTTYCDSLRVVYRWATVSAWIAESIMWLLSMIIIERVLRPCVASIRCLLSLASSLSRFIGAELGATMATTRSAATEFPNPMLSKLFSILPLTTQVVRFTVHRFRVHRFRVGCLEPWPLTSDLWSLTSDLWSLTSDLWPLTSDLWPLTSGLWPPVFIPRFATVPVFFQALP